MARKYHTISHATARELILSQRVNGQGRVFGVAFRRRTTSDDEKREQGSLEVVYCRFGVKKGLKGGCVKKDPSGHVFRTSAAYDRAQHNLFCAFVMGRKNTQERGGDKGFRSIPFEGLEWLKLDGVTYRVGAPPPPQH